MLARLSLIAVLVVSFTVSRDARAECNCVAVAGDVAAAVQAEVAKADGLYARGDFSAALEIYAKAYATSKDAALLYAQGMANWQLGANAKAKEMLSAYVSVGGIYKDRAQAHLASLGAGISATAAAAANAGGRVGELGGGLVGGVTGGVAGGVEGGVGAGADVVGGVKGNVEGKVKVGHKAAVILGVIAIAAIGVVGIHSISAGISDNISLDPKFDLGLGLSGVAVGATAFYVGGLTAAAAAAPHCVATLPAKTPIVAPYATQGGGGLAAAMTF
jgi:hypothetical protein